MTLATPHDVRALLLSALGLCIACSSDVVDVPVGSGGQLVHESARGEPGPQIYVVVADDDASALELRQLVLDGVTNALHRHVEDSWGWCGSHDPAQWRPTDHRIVVVRPSAPADEALVSWIDQPNLWWSSTNTIDEEIGVVAKALLDALSSRYALEGELHRPLRAAMRTLALLGKNRPPETDGEQQLVDSLPESANVNLVIASTRDDEDTTPIDAYLLDEQPFGFVAKWVIGPFDPSQRPCPSPDVADTRLGAWGKLANAVLDSSRCPEHDPSSWDFGQGVADCIPWCIPALPLVLPSGTASCRITVAQPDLEECDPVHGWRDPAGGPAFEVGFEHELRTCEVTQLEGDALEACRHDLQCPGCPAGFCVTEVTELVEESCLNGKHPEPFRFIAGATAGIEHIRIVCDRAN